MTQITIFDGNDDFKIEKPIRLIELFAGYGSQHLALEYLGADFESYRICEWAVKSIQAYKDLHFGDDNTDYSCGLSVDAVIDFLFGRGISADYNKPMTRDQIKRMGEKKCRTVYNNIKATHNLVSVCGTHASDLNITDTEKYCYVMTYSFPCQDLSKAGKGKGMEKGSGTRSGLLWEVERILDECNGNLPQVLVMENVPDVIGSKNVKHFSKWLEKLESLGYRCYWKILNAKNYGVPQNRDRCFMVSILGDYFYEFAEPAPLEKRLKDVLEPEVDEKYYLPDNTLISFENKINKNAENRIGFKFEPTDGNCIAKTLQTREGTRIENNYIKEPQCIQVDIQQTVKVRKNDVDIDGLKRLLREHKHLSNKSIAEKLNQPITLVEHWFRSDSSFAIPAPEVWFDLKKLLEIETDEFDKSIMEFVEKPNEFDMSNRAYHEAGIAPTITTIDAPKCIQVAQLDGSFESTGRIYSADGICPTINTCGGGNREPKIQEPLKIREATEKGYAEAFDGDSVNIAFPNSKTRRGSVGKQVAQTIDTNCQQGVVVGTERIRKLIPLECWRLMGVKDCDFFKVAKNQSDSSLYHLAGDSIVVDVLMAIFRNMLLIQCDSTQLLKGVDTMILKTISDYQKEIDRVQAAIEKTESEHLRNDYEKYLKRLKREMRGVMHK